jgi:hypothetical protein
LRINERSLRRLQKQRHLYDIQAMILTNPLFKNLSKRDQKKLEKLIYKAEMTEMFLRDRNVVRINQSFDQIVQGVANMLNDMVEEQEEERRRREEDDEF